MRAWFRKIKNYYSTGDGSTVDIDESKEIKNENYSEYIKALINMVNGMNGNSDEMTENLTTYVNHLKPALFFFSYCCYIYSRMDNMLFLLLLLL